MNTELHQGDFKDGGFHRNYTEADAQVAAHELGLLIQRMIDQPHDGGIRYLRALWDEETWESIQEKFKTEGSTWYVWWADGVRKYLEDLYEP